MPFRHSAITSLAIILASGLAFCGPAAAQAASEFSTLNRELGDLFQKGEYDQAAVLADRYVALAKEQDGENSPRYATGLSWLAAIAQDRGQYDVAETHYKRILEIDEAALGAEHADVGRDCNNLGLLYQDIGRYAEAEALHNRALSIAEKALGAGHLTVASRLHNKAALFRLQGRYTEAEALLTRALAITEKSSEGEAEDIGKTLTVLGRVNRDMGRYAEAEVYLRRSLAVFETAFGPESLRASYSLHDLAALYQALGQNAEAEAMIQKALAIRQKIFGPEHAEVARSLYVLAGIHEKQELLDVAAADYLRALAIQEKTIGPQHPDAASTKVSLAVLYKSQSRYRDAQALLESALSIQEKALAPDHPAVASSLLPLSEIYRKQGRRDDAEKLFRRARAIRKSSLQDVPVFFATNRKRNPDAKSIEFGTDGDPNLTLGTARLSILKNDNPQNALPPRYRRKKTKNPEDATDVTRLSIPQLDVNDEEAVIAAARRQLQAAQAFKNQAVVFIHGYNVDFENAVRRAGQIAYDLSFDGPTFIFSWPSRQAYFGYLTDRETVDIATEQLKGFLQRVVAPLGAAKVHLVAHSMGNMILLRALSDLSDVDPSRRPVIGEIIDAAPDVAPDIFAQFATKIRTAGGNLTVYASAADKALWISEWLWGRQRVGYIASDGPALITGVDLIDITSASMAIFAINHDVYASSPIVVADMRSILLGERPPDRRTKEFSKVSSKKGKYWIYRTFAQRSRQ